MKDPKIRFGDRVDKYKSIVHRIHPKHSCMLKKNVKERRGSAQRVLESDFERGFSLPELKEYRGKNYYSIPVLPHLEIAYTLRKLLNGKSQLQIDRSLGISYQAYQKLENPRKCNPTIKTLEKISAVLGQNSRYNFHNNMKQLFSTIHFRKLTNQ